MESLGGEKDCRGREVAWRTAPNAQKQRWVEGLAVTLADLRGFLDAEGAADVPVHVDIPLWLDELHDPKNVEQGFYWTPTPSWRTWTSRTRAGSGSPRSSRRWRTSTCPASASTATASPGSWSRTSPGPTPRGRQRPAPSRGHPRRLLRLRAARDHARLLRVHQRPRRPRRRRGPGGRRPRLPVGRRLRPHALQDAREPRGAAATGAGGGVRARPLDLRGSRHGRRHARLVRGRRLRRRHQATHPARGSWLSDADRCRTACRIGHGPWHVISYFGFRVARACPSG